MNNNADKTPSRRTKSKAYNANISNYEDPNIHLVFNDEVVFKSNVIIKNNRTTERVLGKKCSRNLRICIGFTKYDLIRQVAEDYGFTEVGEKNNWNVYWTDGFIGIDKIITLKNFQQVNHFPGMIEICRKDLLARNINRMIKIFPDDFNIIPKTWCLPSELLDFNVFCRNNKDQSFILKPEASCQGKGIFITQSIQQLRSTENMVCQVYVKNPFLMDGYKFDLRIYVLVTSIEPLRIYVYNEGLARLTTVKYEKPNNDNFNNVLMHLTNYSLQKMSQNFVMDEKGGTKRRISVLNDWLKSNGYDIVKLWHDIDDVILKTILSIHSQLKQNYKNSFTNHSINSACFELLGFDILLTNDLRPLLIEVNHSPSFHTDAQIDREVKYDLLWDTFQILNLKPITRREIIQATRDMFWRLNVKKNNKDRSKMRNCKLEMEMKHKGNYRLIYPDSYKSKYDKYVNYNPSLYTETISYRARLKCARKMRQTLRSKQKKNDLIKRRCSTSNSDISTIVRIRKKNLQKSTISRPQTAIIKSTPYKSRLNSSQYFAEDISLPYLIVKKFQLSQINISGDSVQNKPPKNNDDHNSEELFSNACGEQSTIDLMVKDCKEYMGHQSCIFVEEYCFVLYYNLTTKLSHFIWQAETIRNKLSLPNFRMK